MRVVVEGTLFSRKTGFSYVSSVVMRIIFLTYLEAERRVRVNEASWCLSRQGILSSLLAYRLYSM